MAAIRRSSRIFKQSLTAGDAAGMQRASVRAWDALAATFEILRGEQDDGYLADRYMRVPTGFLIEGATSAEQTAMIGAAKIDKEAALSDVLIAAKKTVTVYIYRTGQAPTCTWQA